MKKFLSVLVFAIFILSMNFCSAYVYDNDPDYEFVCAGGGGQSYLYIPSVDVQEYNPPHYQIAGHFVHAGAHTKNYYVALRYNWYTKETFKLDDYGNWRKQNIGDSSSFSQRERNHADALFRAAYRISFYGY